MRDNGLTQALALMGQLGFAIACPMVAFIGGGAWLDNRLGTMPWLLFAGILLGLVAAAGTLYRLTTVQSGKKVDGTASKAPYKVEKRSDASGTNRASKDRHNGR